MKNILILCLPVLLNANIKRQGKITDLKKTALSAELDNGSLVTWLMVSEKKSTFQIQTLLRKALDKILSENPKIWQLSMNQKIMTSG